MTGTSRPQQQPIAIVGVGAITPGAEGPPQFWRAVLTGRDLIGDIPPGRWDPGSYFDPDPAAKDKVSSNRGAFLSEIDFDPLSFGLPPATLPATDTSQMLALKVAEQVLGDAGVPENDRERVGVILGTAALELLQTMSNRMQRPVWLREMTTGGVPQEQAEAICDRIAENYPTWQEMSFPGLLSNVVAGRVANRFDLHGPNYTTDAACAGSLAAVASAVNELATGNADLMITGGVDTLNDILMFKCFSAAQALSKSGDCRPFAADADGTMMGEAVVMFALKRLADAEAAGDKIYAVIKGVGSSSDGRGSAVYAPVAAGQARALRRAYEAARYGPGSVELVEAHGTGTTVGDLTEFTALNSVFTESGREDRQWCALGSAKSQFGHTKSAAGALGMLKTVLALRHKVLPPTIKVDQPNPALDLPNSALYLNTKARPWIRDDAHPRRASVSGFGFGGTNFHLTLEEYIAGGGREPEWFTAAPTELVVASAGSTGELLNALRETVERCQDTGDVTTASRDAAKSFRADAPVRVCLVVRDAEDLAQQVSQLAQLVAGQPEGVINTPAGLCLDRAAAAPGRVALMFGGQGSQHVDMGADVLMQVPTARECWDRAAGLRREGRSLPSVVFPLPVFNDAEREDQQALLTRTEWAQPALAVHGAAMLAVLRTFGLRFDCVGGHSLGELVALHAAGVFDESTLLRLAAGRGEAMRDAAAEAGAMVAVRASAEETARHIEKFAGRVWLANLNGPLQTVVSGHEDAIAELEALLAEKRVGAKRLQTAGAFHTPLVHAARQPFLELLQSCSFTSPKTDVYGNTDASRYPVEVDVIRQRLADHLVSPVRFADQLQAMHDDGVRTFIEIGAGTLARLTSDVLGEQPHLAVSVDRTGCHGVTALQRVLGRLAVAGVELDLSPLWMSEDPVAGTRRPPRMRVRISGANYRDLKPHSDTTVETRMTTTERVVPAPRQLPEPPSLSQGEQQEVKPSSQAPSSRAYSPQTPALQASPPQPTTRPPSALPLAPQTERPVPVPPDSSTRPVNVPDWLSSFELVQAQAANAHTEYQRVMAETHLHYLQFAENSVRLFLGESAGQQPADVTGSARPHAEVFTEATSGPQHPAASPVVEAREHRPVEPQRPPLMEAAPHVQVQPMAPPPWPVAAPPVPEPVIGSKPSSQDAESILLDVVAEKTGYPRNILEPHLELETDLGIDSIKRVEILSHLRTRLPHAPEITPTQLTQLRTLGHIAAHYTTTTPTPNTNQPASIVRAVTKVVPAVVPGLEIPGLRNGPVVVVDGGSGLAQAVVRALREHGVDAAEQSAAVPGMSALVLLGGLCPAVTAEEAIAVNRDVFGTACKAVKEFATPERTLVVVQDTGGDFGLRGAGERAWLGGLAGLARCANHEWRSGVAKAIDVERGGRSAEELAAVIVAELLHGGACPDIALRANGTRWTLRDEREPITSEDSWEPKNPVLVVTGGARGVTASALLALAADGHPSVALLGRTEVTEESPELAGVTGERELRQRIAELSTHAAPAEIGIKAKQVIAAREIRATLAELEKAGCTAAYFAVDVRDEAAVCATLDQVRTELGPITGLVHGAGVLADALLEDKTGGQFDAVFDTKVVGLRTLLAATENDPLDLVCTFSSVAGRFGNAGQSDYAMANEVLALVASDVAARRPGCTVRSIAWGAWDGGMVGPALREHFTTRGVALIDLVEGAEAFRREIAWGTGPARVTVVATDRPDDTASGGLLDGELIGAGSSEAEPAAVGTVRLTSHTHPFLEDHVIGQMPVLPVALVLEWFIGAAQALLVCEIGTISLRNLEVVRGVRLPDLDGNGHELTVKGHRRGSAAVGLTLTDGDGRLCYRATAEISTPRDAQNTFATSNGMLLDSSFWSKVDSLPGSAAKEDHYAGEVLFHGKAFRALTDLRCRSTVGALADLCGVNGLDGWPPAVWHTDPAAVDGALQLALLWAAQATGGAHLPMSVEEIRIHLPGLLTQGLSCAALAVNPDPVQPICDITMFSEDWGVVAELLGVGLVRRPGHEQVRG
ncbi:SDR family NAD(P)-dependent oxidoreductase [Lentzea sp. NPDC042327]|uniref:SDR family NAD(P)-dependent oxidoreductase n=1 Tax=Lentzea sp. NPDC042327 TaxID=3154801 RepID=UPI00340B7511